MRLAAAASATLVLGAALTVAADRRAPEAALDIGDPVAGNSGFAVLTESDAVLGSSETDGAVAVGGDLAFGRGAGVALKSPGSFTASGDSRPTSLLVNGRVDYGKTASDGLLRVLGRGHVKVGDMAGSTALDRRDGREPANTAVVAEGGAWASVPRIELNTRQPAETVRASGLLDFARLFTSYRERAETMAQCAKSVTLRSPNGDPLPDQNRVPAGSDIGIALATGRTNVLRLTGEALNNMERLTLRDRPSARAPLLIVVDTTASGGELTWRTPEMAGPDGSAPHIIWDFPDATSITMTGGGRVEGTVFAPRARLTDASPGTVEGGVIAHSLTARSLTVHSPTAPSSSGPGSSAQDAGALRGSPFDGRVSCRSAPTPGAVPTDQGG